MSSEKEEGRCNEGTLTHLSDAGSVSDYYLYIDGTHNRQKRGRVHDHHRERPCEVFASARFRSRVSHA